MNSEVNKEEKEYRCRKCKKVVKESQLRKDKDGEGDFLECPFCLWRHVYPLKEVDWVSKVIGKEG